jgi:hypothetical protein
MRPEEPVTKSVFLMMKNYLASANGFFPVESELLSDGDENENQGGRRYDEDCGI